MVAISAAAIAAGLLGASTLFGIGRSHWNAREQRQIYARQEEYSKKQADEWDRRLADYRRNTGLEPRYEYTGLAGQSRYMRQVSLPSYSNLYSQLNANVWSGGFQGLTGVGATGAYAYNRWYNSGYRPSDSKAGGYDPSYLGG